MADSNGTELVVSVPQGGQVIRTFNLTPSLPQDGKAGDWPWVDASASSVLLSGVRVRFSVDSSATEQEFERAILIINLQQNSKETGYWRFSQNGVALNPEYRDIYQNVDFEVVNDGETLIAYVQVLGLTQGHLKFGFLASFTDASSGVVSTYESKDPDILPVRP